MDALSKLLAAVGGFWQGMSGAQRVAFLSIALMTAGTLALLGNFAGRTEYATLFSQLEPKDAARISDELAKLDVPFELTHAGTAIGVPAESVYELRLQLASKGLGVSGPVGFELFNDGGLGVTPFQERIRFRRALEGELSRTISQLRPVNWARVHVNIPDKAVFRRDRKKASAAVVVSLAPGESLSAGEVNGIAELVAAAVEEMDAKQVTILDTAGRLMARPGGNDADMQAAEVLDVQRSIEKKLASHAQTLLDAVIGAGKSVITVAAQVERSRVEEDHDRVNPNETAVLSEQRTEEVRSEPSSSAGGVPGTRTNVPGGEGAEAGGGGNATENVTRETINFEISRSRSRTVVPMGGIQRLSIAVLLDGTYTRPEAAEGEQASVPVYQPRPAEEISRISEIVKRSVGFDAERGDQIEVQNMPFRSPLEDVASEPLPLWQQPELFLLLPAIARAIAVLGAVILLIFLVIRPALRQLAGAAPAIATGTMQVAIEPGGAEAATGQIAASNDADKLAHALGTVDPKMIADAMKQWLRE